jgi:hypothetical protein
MAMVWSAVLYAGTGAAACGPTALWLTGAIDERPALVHVAVPASRRVVRQPGIRIHLSRALDDKVRDIAHPSARPRRLRLEWALLEVCDRENSSMAIHLILQAIQRRLTSAEHRPAATPVATANSPHREEKCGSRPKIHSQSGFLRGAGPPAHEGYRRTRGSPRHEG